MKRATQWLGVVAGLVVAQAAAVGAAPDWNGSAISWRSFEDGMKEAAATNRPALVIFESATCPYCARYSKVFHDQEVVAAVKQFVPVLVDVAARPDLVRQFMPPPGGVRTPTTFVLGPDGRRRLAVFAGAQPTQIVLMRLRQALAMWERVREQAPAGQGKAGPGPARAPAQAKRQERKDTER